MISAATLFQTPAFDFCFVFRFQDISSVRSIKHIVRHWQVGPAVWAPHFVLSHYGPVLAAGVMDGPAGHLIKMSPGSNFLLAPTCFHSHASVKAKSRQLSQIVKARVLTIKINCIYKNLNLPRKVTQINCQTPSFDN